MTFRYLSDETLDQVRSAVDRAGLGTDTDLAGLAVGIPSTFTNQFMVGANPRVKLLMFTERLNTTQQLLSGFIPLEKWLKNAIFLSTGLPEELVFRAALEQMSADGAPAVARPDLAAVPERDGELEVVIGEDNTLGVDFLLDGVEAALSVANLRVHRHYEGVPQFVVGDQPNFGKGTGWLVAPDLLMTNHHVVDARGKFEAAASNDDFDLQGRSIEADFDFYDDSSEVITAHSVECIASSGHDGDGLDYAILQLRDGGPGRRPLRLRINPIVRMLASPLSERVNVLQHPGGEHMRLGFRANFVITASAGELSYLTDTDGGASGSPIFDDAWFVAGLHRGFRTIAEGPIEVWGTKIKQENYGTPIGKILEDLADRFPDVSARISAAQDALTDPPND